MKNPQTTTDQLGRTLTIPIHPKRIISLVPSQTELLFYLGLEEEVVGITKFCVHPIEQFRKKTKVGGTKQIKLDLIDQLKPDLIIANKEENDKAQIEALAAKYPVWISDIYNLKDALAIIKAVGKIINCSTKAQVLASSIEHEFASLPKPEKRPKAAYFIWRNPWMVAGNQTFIHHMLHLAGFENAFADQNRYPTVTAEQLKEANPEVLFLSSEPYPFKQKHLAELQEVCPRAVIKLVDGELFSWYGNRLLHSATYFRNLRVLVEKQLNNEFER